MANLAKVAQSATLCCGVTLAAIVIPPEGRVRPTYVSMRGSQLLPPALAGRLGEKWTGVAGYAAAQFSTPERSAPQRLRDLSGLPITVLATLSGVSRQTYHGWLVGDSVSHENRGRLDALIATLSEISAYQDVRRFLRRQIYGTTPQELLEAGRYELAIQIARGSLLAEPTQSDVVTPIPWDDPPSDLLVSYLYHIDPAAVRPEREQASEVYTDEVIALGSVIITG